MTRLQASGSPATPMAIDSSVEVLSMVALYGLDAGARSVSWHSMEQVVSSAHVVKPLASSGGAGARRAAAGT